MTLTEFCLLAMTLFMAMITVALVFVVARLLPMLASLETLVKDATETTRQVNGMTAELTHVVQDLRQTQSRVNGLASVVLNQVEPPIHQAAAVISGVRAGLGALIKPRKQHQ